MNKGIVYLIQPCELIGTSRYKVGCSKKTDLDRCKNGYKKGSRYICIMECTNPLLLESTIKKNFNNKFTLIAGSEYYEGEENKILKYFIDIIFDYKNSSEEINNTDIINVDNKDDEYNKLDEDIKKIKTEFINWNDDEYFGGKKQLIKFFIETDKIKITYIDNYCLCEKIINDELILDLINKLIKSKIIKNNIIYDFNKYILISKLIKFKNKINVKLLYKHKYINNKLNSIEDKINYYIHNNYIINNIFCSEISPNHFYINNKHLYIQNIKNEYYDIEYLKKYIPYCIEINNKNDDCYLINRNYEYIGIIDNINNINTLYNFIKVNPLSDENIKWSRFYLFNDKTTPWKYNTNIQKIYLKLIGEYNKLTLNKKCLNLIKETQSIFDSILNKNKSGEFNVIIYNECNKDNIKYKSTEGILDENNNLLDV
jgi:hypothetical protein